MPPTTFTGRLGWTQDEIGKMVGMSRCQQKGQWRNAALVKGVLAGMKSFLCGLSGFELILGPPLYELVSKSGRIGT
jgi:hypothetical protein